MNRISTLLRASGDAELSLSRGDEEAGRGLGLHQGLESRKENLLWGSMRPSNTCDVGEGKSLDIFVICMNRPGWVLPFSSSFFSRVLSCNHAVRYLRFRYHPILGSNQMHRHISGRT